MKNTDIEAERKTAIHLLRSGYSVQEVAVKCNRSSAWVRKWRGRYEAGGWSALKGRSQAPKRHGNKISAATKRAIVRTRSELEADAASGIGLKYIGARAVRTRLKKRRLKQVPSRATIERVLKEAGMTRHYEKKSKETKVKYPTLHPTEPHQLIQVDIVPHFLTGGSRMPCFNAIDIVSRYPTGLAFHQRRSLDAAEFLIHTWQHIGIPRYTQVDNEGCFSGGATHPNILGKVVRLALRVGTELVFSPVYHPASNGYVERFHQDYNRHVWDDTYLANQTEVNRQAATFFANYRQSLHHKALNEQSPHTRHWLRPPTQLGADFAYSDEKLPLYSGRVHFMRKVEPDKTIRVLNTTWAISSASPGDGVWATITLLPNEPKLHVYDTDPISQQRSLLATHPFHVKEAVLAAPAL